MGPYQKNLPIFNINTHPYPQERIYPIQPYPFRSDDYTGLPSPAFRQLVSCYHQMWMGNNNPDSKIYPSQGCAIVWVSGKSVTDSFLVGAPTFPRDVEYIFPECLCFVAIFWPDTGFSIFSHSIEEAVDTHIPLDMIFPSAADCFNEKMASAKNFLQRINIFETFLKQILVDYTSIPVEHKKMLDQIVNHPGLPLAIDRPKKPIARELSRRHIQRLCIKYLGIAPKLIARISRYQQALHILNVNPSVNMADLAISTGHHDQSHFIKEFKRFQNMTPIEFLSQFSVQ